MKETEAQVTAPGENPAIPAGFTYLGQFVDHDLTFDPASSLQRMNDTAGLLNFRTPRFDLDSLYGEGPADEPFLYSRTSGGAKLLVGHNPPQDTDGLDLSRLGRLRFARLCDRQIEVRS